MGDFNMGLHLILSLECHIAFTLAIVVGANIVTLTEVGLE